MNRTDPHDIVSGALAELPDGAYLTAAVVIVTYVVPGEDDDDERGPFLMWRCDGVAGRWTHLGMVETMAGDCRANLRCRDDETDD